MSTFLPNGWILFCILFGLLLLFTFIMNLQGSYFYTKDVVVRKFSILDLALASSPVELVNIIKGLYQLPPGQSEKAVNALKGQLYVDFLFMPCAYGSIFLLCQKVAERMQLSIGYYIFAALAWLQLVAWLCDIIENIYLLGKIRPDPVLSALSRHKDYLAMEGVKWGISLTGTACSLSAVCYFWLSGNYSSASLPFIVVVIVEIILFFIMHAFFIRKKNRPEQMQAVQR
jgi:hypothetical protein